MISPEAYIEELKNASYTELISERKKLIKRINMYEKNEASPMISFFIEPMK